MKNFRNQLTVIACLVGTLAFAEDKQNTTGLRNDPTQSGKGVTTTTTSVRELGAGHTNADATRTNRKNTNATKWNDNRRNEARRTETRNTRNVTAQGTFDNNREDYSDAEFEQNDRENVRADSTRKNVRDRNMDSTVTPLDQSRGSNSDVSITRRIRAELMQDDALSTYAKNVKIITLNGIVTLRGPVRSTEERRLISSHARKFVSPNMIVNRLEIAPTDSAR